MLENTVNHLFNLSSKLNTATKIYFQDHMLPQQSAHVSQDKYPHTVEDMRIYSHTLCDENMLLWEGREK